MTGRCDPAADDGDAVSCGMAFQWACFLSYRHSDSDIGRYAVTAFHQALKNELALLSGLPIYVDERNQAGFFYNEVIATALCRSVCMVMMYWPEYFSPVHHYCAREYHAMLTLEKKRLAMLPPDERHFGLIIPVMIRGRREQLPSELKDNRLCAEFTDLSILSQPMSENPNFAPRVREIAQYIDDRRRAFDIIARMKDPCSGCTNFVLPTYDDIKDWLATLHQPPPFPRGGSRNGRRGGSR